jgi:hypothetical protein
MDWTRFFSAVDQVYADDHNEPSSAQRETLALLFALLALGERSGLHAILPLKLDDTTADPNLPG